MLEPDGLKSIDEIVACFDRSDRSRLLLTGPDRAKFLHNLTTNDVKRLKVGRGCEAFVTSPQGKTIGFINVLACDDSILITADPGGLGLVIPHFQKYGVFDEVELDDQSASTFEYHLAGPRTEALVKQIGLEVPGPDRLDHRAGVIGGSSSIHVVREMPTGRPGLTLIGPIEAAVVVRDLLRSQGESLGLTWPGPETFEVARIEAGTPVFGKDFDEKNLPQELGRDDLAISFVKGCYLGQETVARIDALGHVNQLLKGLQFVDVDDPPPLSGFILEADGKRAGGVTSSAFSPGWNAVIALAMVRRNHAAAGTELSVKAPSDPDGKVLKAIVRDLPMLPPSARLTSS